jgi:hypothetical protein
MNGSGTSTPAEVATGLPAVWYACSRKTHSRAIACMWLKDSSDAARVLVVATGMITPAQLPPSCSHLQTPQLPSLPELWAIGWTDTCKRHKRTGLIR